MPIEKNRPMLRRSVLGVMIVLFFTSCVPKKRLTYLQSEGSDSNPIELQRSYYAIQPNDMLSINIRSMDEETNELFNLASSAQINPQMGDLIFYLNGYSVDLEGFIDIPVLGKMYVKDKTIEQIRKEITDSLGTYFNEDAFNVLVQLAGIRFTVIGEVQMPGSFVLYQNQTTIFDALSRAGDITMVGDRKNVTIVRQVAEGKVQTFTLDLTQRDVIGDPNYFIYPNDIINVQPLPQKSYGIGTTGFETFSQLFSVAVSTISLIIVLNNIN